MSAHTLYSGYIRVRVGGLYLEDDKLLLIKLKSPITNQLIWVPPGGGVDFKEPLEKALIREFLEETTLNIEVRKLNHINEFIENEFHVIELFFDVMKLSGTIILGTDPEHSENDQLIHEIGLFTRSEIESMNVKPDYLRNKFWELTGNTSFSSHR